MLNLVDSLLDRLTMYRLAIYYLLGLLGVAMILSQLGYLHFDPLAIAGSAAFLVAVCWVTHHVFAYVFGAPANPESTIITALILALIITPNLSVNQAIFLMAAGGLSIASRYILAIHKRHIFNPAAIAVVLTSFGAGQSASWWVGSTPLLPFVIIGGLLLARKINRLTMTSLFIGVSYLATIFYTLLLSGNVLTAVSRLTLSSSLFFMAFVMLDEPFTSPRNSTAQQWYAFATGMLFPPQFHLFSFYLAPEIVLAVGNVFSYIIDPPTKALLTLQEKIERAPGIYDFVFTPNKPFKFKPGQYIELAVPHHNPDSRGNRRYFTIASSPTEPEVRLGIKFYPNGSSYKHALLAANADSQIVATQLGGNFTLPENPAQKLAFIAGGIGITPFRSMVQYLIDAHERRDIAVLYGAASAKDFVYVDTFEKARSALGINTVYCASDGNVPAGIPAARAGSITAERIQAELPDYTERTFYISGPYAMVHNLTNTLHLLGVPAKNIKVDFFPGY